MGFLEKIIKQLIRHTFLHYNSKLLEKFDTSSNEYKDITSLSIFYIKWYEVVRVYL